MFSEMAPIVINLKGDLQGIFAASTLLEENQKSYSFANDFIHSNLLGLCSDDVHSTNQSQLVMFFQIFSDSLFLCNLLVQFAYTLFRVVINFNNS